MPSMGFTRQLAVGIMVFHALVGTEMAMGNKPSVTTPVVSSITIENYNATMTIEAAATTQSRKSVEENKDAAQQQQQQQVPLREMPFNPRSARRILRRGMRRPNKKAEDAAAETTTERKTQEETTKEEQKEEEKDATEKKDGDSEDGKKEDGEATEKEEEEADAGEKKDEETTEQEDDNKKKTEPSKEEENKSADNNTEEESETTQDTKEEEEAETESEEKQESEDETKAAPEPVEEKEEPKKDAPPPVEPENVSSKSVAADNISNNINEFNALEFSMTLCEKLDMAVRLITSLDFEEHFEKTFDAFYSSSGSVEDSNEEDTSMTRRTAGVDTATFADAEAKFFAEVVMLQMVLLPISIAFLLLGGVFFYPACILCAAVIGLLGVFDVIEGVLPIKLDCPMKLSLSIVAAFLSAVLAVSFFRFGLFCFGSVSIGGITYLLMDSFPEYLDPGVIVFQTAETSKEMLKSVSKDLSTPGWVLICCCSIAGGMILRFHEQATLELLTAALGGVGCAYSVHSLLLVRRYSLDPSFVFLLAFFLGVSGWRIQRYRRLKAFQRYYVPRPGASSAQLPITNQDSAAWMAAQQQQQMQLQQQMQQLLMQGPATDRAGLPSSDQISELTSSINRFLQVVEKGQQDQEGAKTERDAKDE